MKDTVSVVVVGSSIVQLWDRDARGGEAALPSLCYEKCRVAVHRSRIVRAHHFLCALACVRNVLVGNGRPLLVIKGASRSIRRLDRLMEAGGWEHVAEGQDIAGGGWPPRE